MQVRAVIFTLCSVCLASGLLAACEGSTPSTEKSVCGDGEITGAEECDGDLLADETCDSRGYSGGTLACDATACTFDVTGCGAVSECGNGLIEAGEECDSDDIGNADCTTIGAGFTGGLLACNNGLCAFDTSGCTGSTCGDGVVSFGEDCDSGDLDGADCTTIPGAFTGGALACNDAACLFDTSGCSGGAVCGDGTLDASEDCDGADLAGNDCTTVAGSFDAGLLACDAVSCLFDTTGCSACGDDVVAGPEICDGADLDGASCTSLGYNSGTLGCLASCAGFDTAACVGGSICGDAAAEGLEACDGADLSGEDCLTLGWTGGSLACYAAGAADECSFDVSGCTGTDPCGNGSLDAGELCDGAELDGYDCASLGFDPAGTLACLADCSTFDTSGCTGSGPVCGDGAQEGLEDCDGGDLGGADCLGLGFTGGSLSCAADCTYDVSSCSTGPVCGDGVVAGGEACDGSDLADNDCTTVAGGFSGGILTCDAGCTFDTSGCTSGPVCGDGTVDAGEDCDGADLAGNDCTTVPGGFSGGSLLCGTGCLFDTSGCVSNPACGNDNTNGSEVCDGTDLNGETCLSLSYPDGVLACLADCSAYDFSGCTGGATCGDDVTNGSEVCDGADLNGESCTSLSLPAGVLGCLPDCSAYDTSGCVAGPICGDGVTNGSDVCDGVDLNGETCFSLGLPTGVLACQADCSAYDDAGCTGALLANGSACTVGSECAGGICLDEPTIDWPGGFCTSDCSATGCLVGDECLDLGAGMFCLPNCTADGDCRGAYSCFDAFSVLPICLPDCLLDSQCPANGVCNPYDGRCRPLQGVGVDGDACTGAADCESGACVDEATYGWPGGYCLSNCSLAADNCPGDGVCQQVYSTTLMGGCMDGCSSDGDCRQAEGYTCDAGICVPGLPPICGDNVTNGGDVCDGVDLNGESCVSLGRPDGVLACLADCSDYDDSGCTGFPICGDGVTNGADLCDGLDLNGETCASLGLPSGPLACLGDCSDYDVAGCTGAALPDGAACSANAQCAGGTCLTELNAAWPGGFCTSDCSVTPCGPGAECFDFGGPFQCIPNCLTQTDCRGGYSCWDGFGSASVCLPDCLLASECPTNGECNPYNGYCVPQQSRALDGEACLVNADCESGFCVDEATNGWPGGYCTSYCSLEANNCPGDSACIALFGLTQLGACMDGCVSDSDCRLAEGYSCQAGVCAVGAPAVCGDSLTNGTETCDGIDLNGETCLSLGLPDGVLACLADCSGYDSTGCTGVAICGDNLTNGTDVCDGVDLNGESCASLGQPSGVLACLADCSAYDTTGCTGAGSVTGGPCVTGADCQSGGCIDEATSAWPGGYCVSDCTATACGAGEECLDFGGPMYCVDVCTTQVNCRAGYSCWDAFSTQPICLPDCVLDAECPAAGVCNPYVGYCTAVGAGAVDGAGCLADADCESGFCIDQATSGWPGGYCSSYCSQQANNCPGDEQCIDLFGFALLGGCLDGCATDGDCRQAEGYTCITGVCAP